MLQNLEEEVVQKLKVTQHLLYTVESCTGGFISNLITNVSGASAVFFGSTIVYDNAAKQELGVPEEIIASQGAVSPEVALALAEQGLKKLQTNPFLAKSHSLLKPRGFICVSTTGIAGPSGGSKEKPVGLCYIGLAKTGQPTLVEPFQVPSPQDRLDTKLQFTHKALELLLKNL
jgi:nicotinamide mononucleotide (NMN) deamidase PncC